MKRVALFAFFLILSAIFHPNYSHASMRLFVGDDEVALENSLVMMNGNFMIPIWVFEEYLGAEVLATDGNIHMVFGDQNILMQLGKESAQVDGKTHQLDVAPQLIEGELVIPLLFIANQRGWSLLFDQNIMAFRLEPSQKRAPQFTSLTSILLKDSINTPDLPPRQLDASDAKAEPVVSEPIIVYHPEERQGLREIVYMGGPRSRVFLDLLSYTGYETHLLTEPDRLVIDFNGVEGDALPPIEVNDDPVIRSIRSSRFDEQTMRIVCDLKASTGYRLTPWPEGGVEIEFNFQLTAIELEEDSDSFRLRFEASAAPIIDTVYLEEPLRLVLDLQETTLMIRSFDRVINQGRIARFRVSQHTPSVTRVVLQVTEPVAPLPLEQLDQGSFVLPLFAGTPREVHAYMAAQLEPSTIMLTEGTPATDGVLSGLTVVVDPGHGGSDPGTIGYQGTFEKDVNLAIALQLGEFLSQAGARVVYTRNTDVYVSIFERPEIAAKANADLYVSLHANASLDRGKVRGTETLYRAQDPASQLFASTVQEELVNAITLANRRIWGRDDLAVFNNTRMPAIMVEVGFLDHPDEEVLLRAPGFQEVAAQGIYSGIARFYLENKK